MWIIAITVGCIFLTSWAYTNSVIGMLIALLMISVCWIIAEMVRVHNRISSYHFTVYIFSWFFQAVMMAICGRLECNWIYTFLGMFGIGIIGPAIVILLYEKLPFFHKRGIKLLIGMR